MAAASTGMSSPQVVVSTRPQRGRARKLWHSVGELAVTVGLIMLLFTSYELVGKQAEIANSQRLFSSTLDQQWHSPVDSPDDPVVYNGPLADGQPFARLYLPGLALNWAVVEGVSLTDLRHGPGHYPDSQRPGQVGNFAMAGHREPGVFWDLDQIRVGDPVVVETDRAWWIYQVTESLVVKPTSVEVVRANPADPARAPTKAMLTLTTCNPKWGNWQRLVVHAALVRATGKSHGRPAELGG